MISADDIARARSVLLEHEIARRGIKLKRAGTELVGPCAVCGGADRFGINARKQIWNCRQCSVGGDIIKLVEHIDGLLQGGDRHARRPYCKSGAATGARAA
jgi:phage/plasmid primase-like uncharacterized protein